MSRIAFSSRPSELRLPHRLQKQDLATVLGALETGTQKHTYRYVTTEQNFHFNPRIQRTSIKNNTYRFLETPQHFHYRPQISRSETKHSYNRFLSTEQHFNFRKVGVTLPARQDGVLTCLSNALSFSPLAYLMTSALGQVNLLRNGVQVSSVSLFPAPQSGLFLGYTGTELAWQTPVQTDFSNLSLSTSSAGALELSVSLSAPVFTLRGG